MSLDLSCFGEGNNAPARRGPYSRRRRRAAHPARATGHVARRGLRRRGCRHGRGGAPERRGSPSEGRHSRPGSPGPARFGGLPRAARVDGGSHPVLSAVGDEGEKVAALDAGADDYVTKPFGTDELLARLRAALRRTAPETGPIFEIGELVVDLDKRSVTFAGEPVALTPNEFDLLRLFARNEGKLLTHPAILREVWGPAYDAESHYLHVYVSQLRRKLEPDPARPRYLLTEPGAGYRLVDPLKREA